MDDRLTNGAYGATSGTEQRDSRQLMEGLMVFSLRLEIDMLRNEDQYANGDRSSLTLAKEVDFRALLSVLRPGATLDEQDGDARASIHVIEGGVTLTAGDETTELGEGQLAVIDAGRPWALTAATESAVLLTLAWPREKAGV